MLRSFKTDNYKIFADGFTLSMIPNMKHKDLPWSIQEDKAAGKTYKALSSAVIYGPNASGKSNLISAVDTFQRILTRGHILNGTARTRENFAGDILELLPNRFLDAPKPVSFEIDFVTDGVQFNYAFAADIGSFMDHKHARSVVSESFAVNEQLIFRRNQQNFEFGDLESIPDSIWGDGLGRRLERAQLAQNLVRPTDLFLQNGFRTSVSPWIVERFNNWLVGGLQVICNAQDLYLVPESSGKDGSDTELIKALTRVLKRVSPNSDWAEYVSLENHSARLCVGLEDPGTREPVMLLPAELYESYGTVRLLGILPAILHALNTGATLMMDEFDASLHPAISQGIVSAFHDDSVNVHKAQLIMNTHNVVHMNSALFRRDEIHLIELDRKRHSSEHYTLADFKTSGENQVRKDEAYMRKYLKEAYGAYPDIDVHELLGALARTADSDEAGNAGGFEESSCDA